MGIMADMIGMADLAGMNNALFRWSAQPGDNKRHPTATRNNDPSYRKSIWPEGKVANAGRMG